MTRINRCGTDDAQNTYDSMFGRPDLQVTDEDIGDFYLECQGKEAPEKEALAELLINNNEFMDYLIICIAVNQPTQTAKVIGMDALVSIADDLVKKHLEER